MEIIWSEEDQTYFTVPDGDIATHKQIYEYYNNTKTLAENKLYKNKNYSYKNMEEIEYNHIPHLY